MSSSTVPKAILYSFPESIWCSVPLLALQEKGYGEDEFELKTVDLGQGEQYSLSYLRINPAGTVPTLVVPVEGSLQPDEEHQFRALRDSTAITDFLDKSRNATSRTHTTSTAPAPSLSPATMEGSTLSKSIIELIHDPKGADPNLLELTARTPAELEERAKMWAPLFTSMLAAAEKNLSQLNEGSSSRIRVFLEKKVAENTKMADLFKNPKSAAGEEWMALSKAVWQVNLKDVLTKLDKLIVGPYALGDQLSIADLHVAAWLARVVWVSGGQAKAADLAKVETQIGGDFKMGEKVKMFWAAIILRPSFKSVYKDGLH